MSTGTTNYNIKKPEKGVDPFQLSDWNDNMDIIDTEIFNGRDSDNITNSSNVSGANTSDALDTVKGQLDSISAAASNADIGVWYVNDTTNTDTYAGTLSGLTLFSGLRIDVEITNNNTGASSFNLNAGGAVAIKINSESGTQRDTYADEMYGVNRLMYDGTYWVLLNPKEGVIVEETLSNETSILSSGTGIDSSNNDQDYNSVIEDGFSKFELEGHSVVNPLTNGDFSNSTTGWTGTNATLAESGQILSVTGNGTGDRPRAYQDFSSSQQDDKIFAYAKCNVDNGVAQDIRIELDGSTGGTAQVISESSPTQDIWYEIYGIITVPNDWTGNTRIKLAHNYIDAATANGKVMEVDGTAGVFAINLTALGLDTYFTSKGYNSTEQEAILLDWVRNGYFEGLTNNKTPILSSVGKNLFDGNLEQGSLSTSDGSEAVNTARCRTEFIKIQDLDYYLSMLNNGRFWRYIVYYDSTKSFISFTSLNSISVSFNPPDECVYVRVVLSDTDGVTEVVPQDFEDDELQLEEGTSATTYEPYKSSISFLKDVDLGSTQNGTRDRIYTADDGNVYFEKKIEKESIATATAVNTTNLTNASSSSYYILVQDDGVESYGQVDGTYTTTDAGTIHYELATPEIINLTELLQATGSLQTFKSGTMYLEGFVDETFTATGTSQVLTGDFKEVTAVYYLDGTVYTKLSEDTWTYTESTKTLSGITNTETYRVEGSPSYFIPPTSEITYNLNKEARNASTASAVNENKNNISSLSDALALIIANL